MCLRLIEIPRWSFFLGENHSTMLRGVISVTIVAWMIAGVCESYRILGVFPSTSYSHQVVFRAVTVGLSKRGHEVVTFTPDPLNDPSLKNYKEIDMHHTYEYLKDKLYENKDDFWALMSHWNDAMGKITEAILSHPEMQRIIAPESNEHFDVILVEHAAFDAIYGLMKRLDAPVIGVVSLQVVPNGHYAIGNTIALAYAPSLMATGTSQGEMNFWDRLENAYFNYRMILTEYNHVVEVQDKLLKKYFGADMPFAGDLAKNVSLVLANSHVMLTYPRPNLPSVIEIGGISLNRTLKKLDEDLREFLDGASNGFVYFSLGSNAKSRLLPANVRNALISAFSELPYRVLWKWEDDTLPGKPDNVFISKWLPQYTVLAHPNIKVFVYQGGLQSTEEAIDNAVPLIGIPVFGDQFYQVDKIVSVGIGKRLNLDELTKEAIKDAITEVIADKRYKERIIEFRETMNDQPETPAERAVWWTEYVIRHRGAPHLRTRVRYLAWYERELLDLVVFVVSVAVLVIYLIYRLISLFLRMIFKQSTDARRKKLKTK